MSRNVKPTGTVVNINSNVLGFQLAQIWTRQTGEHNTGRLVRDYNFERTCRSYKFGDSFEKYDNFSPNHKDSHEPHEAFEFCSHRVELK